jgi:hypothetical protein
MNSGVGCLRRCHLEREETTFGGNLQTRIGEQRVVGGVGDAGVGPVKNPVRPGTIGPPGMTAVVDKPFDPSGLTSAVIPGDASDCPAAGPERLTSMVAVPPAPGRRARSTPRAATRPFQLQGNWEWKVVYERVVGEGK